MLLWWLFRKACWVPSRPNRRPCWLWTFRSFWSASMNTGFAQRILVSQPLVKTRWDDGALLCWRSILLLFVVASHCLSFKPSRADRLAIRLQHCQNIFFWHANAWFKRSLAWHWVRTTHNSRSFWFSRIWWTLQGRSELLLGAWWEKNIYIYMYIDTFVWIWNNIK